VQQAAPQQAAPQGAPVQQAPAPTTMPAPVRSPNNPVVAPPTSR
jgi:hypothetical protein